MWTVIFVNWYFLHMQMGAYHTIELELNRKFTLAKKVWDSVVLDRIGNVLFFYFYCFVFSDVSSSNFAQYKAANCMPYKAYSISKKTSTMYIHYF